MKGRLIVSIQFALLILMVLAPARDRSSLVYVIFGSTFVAIGSLVIAISFRDLGNSLTVMPESKEGASLITSGIYSKVRHPIYSAIFLVSAGFLLIKMSAASIMVFGALSCLLVYKARYEDKILLEKFPEASDYQKSTNAFLPKIRK